MPDIDKSKRIVLDASDNAFHAFGYSYIFEKRIAKYLKYISAIKFIGLAIPIVIGTIVLGYGGNSVATIIAIAIGTPILIIQITLSLLSLIYNWDDELAYAYEAKHDFINLYADFKELYKNPDSEISQLDKQYSILNTKYTLRRQQNSKHKISDKELRIGMRYSLREHQKQCSGCKKAPTDMTSTECGVCGNF